MRFSVVEKEIAYFIMKSRFDVRKRPWDGNYTEVSIVRNRFTLGDKDMPPDKHKILEISNAYEISRHMYKFLFFFCLYVISSVKL